MYESIGATELQGAPGLTGAPYQINESDKDKTLKQYVLSTADILGTCKNHGLIETNVGDFVISARTCIDPSVFAEAAENFQRYINSVYKEKIDGV